MSVDPAALTARLAADPAAAGLFMDFDGTLAPIVANPQESAMPASLRPVLADLAGALGVVAVVSGRPAGFLLEHVDVPGVRLLGLYGLEEARDGGVAARPEAEDWQPAVVGARDRLADALGEAEGVLVEDKRLSVAVHWRHAPDREQAQRDIGALAQALAADTGLALEPGKFVLELRPPLAWDKGAAVAAVIQEAGTATPCYCGDDLGDLPAFAAVRERAGVAVGVGQGSQTPPALRAAVDLMFPGADEFAGWLTALRDTLAG